MMLTPGSAACCASTARPRISAVPCCARAGIATATDSEMVNVAIKRRMGMPPQSSARAGPRARRTDGFVPESERQGRDGLSRDRLDQQTQRIRPGALALKVMTSADRWAQILAWFPGVTAPHVTSGGRMTGLAAPRVEQNNRPMRQA